MSVIEFLQVSEAIRLMVELDYDPHEDRFLECSAEQRQALAEQGYDTSKPWFVVSRSGSEPSSAARGEPRLAARGEPRLVDETEREMITGVAAGVLEETEASGRAFASFRARLEHVSGQMPEVVWKQGGPRSRPRVSASVPGPT